MGNHTNFKGMFNKERIENLEKRISRIEQIQNAECNSAQMERRVQRALIDSNNEVVRRIFDDVSVNSVYGVDVFSPKTGDIRVRNAVFSGEVFKQAAPNGIHDYLKRVEELSDGRYKEVVWLRGELKNQEQAVEKLKDENKQLKYDNSKMEKITLDSICGESDAVVRYLDLKKRYEDLEKKKKTLLDSVRELQKQVYDVSRDKKYLEIANTSLLQETRKTKGVLNEKIKKLRQRLKQSSIRYRDLKESIPHNGLKSV